MTDGLDAFARLLSESRRTLVFTGAGISTGSGIADFRGPQGIWKTRKPVYFHDFMASEEARVEHWDYKLETWESFRDATPNAAHRAVHEIEKRGRLELLVTQNIDGLHHDAGHDPAKVVEIHGTNRRIECTTCGDLTDPDPAFAEFKRTRKPPACACGGFLKSATVSFGQSMPQEKLQRAFAAAAACDLAVSIGSTLEVHPAAAVPLEAAQRGTAYVIVNRGETAQDELATVRLEGDAVELLPEAVRRAYG